MDNMAAPRTRSNAHAVLLAGATTSIVGGVGSGVADVNPSLDTSTGALVFAGVALVVFVARLARRRYFREHEVLSSVMVGLAAGCVLLAVVFVWLLR